MTLCEIAVHSANITLWDHHIKNTRNYRCSQTAMKSWVCHNMHSS